jgi:hypothetical protein
MNRKLSVFAISGCFMYVAPAQAQLWNPLDTVNKPNAIIAHDTSVTMSINTQCTDCHTPNNRLEVSKREISQTLRLFEPYFVYGAFQYSGCDYAKVVGRVMPTPDDPTISFNQVLQSINQAQACRERENRLPGGAAQMCIRDCGVQDRAIIGRLVSGQLNGFDPLLPFLHRPCAFRVCPGDGDPCHHRGVPWDWPTALTDAANGNPAMCLNGDCYHIRSACTSGGTYDIIDAALARMAVQMRWPRWTPSALTAATVEADFCAPLRQIMQDVVDERANTCNPAPGSDLTVNWCDSEAIARNVCAPSSPLANTCVCDQTRRECITGGMAASSCGHPFDWKARQQVAVCESYDPLSFGSYFTSQDDNVASGGCRENAALFFTDGYMGQTGGVAAEAGSAQFPYRSVSGLSNMAVYRVSTVFQGDADAMMRSLSAGQVGQSLDATNGPEMQTNMARLLNRIYKGVYRGASMAMDDAESRVAIHSFTVPGYSSTGPISDDYLGWPARISLHEVSPQGDILPAPIFETDWESRANAAPICGPGNFGAFDRNRIGPDGVFRNGVSRGISVASGSMDRDGDGSPDAHPALRLGKMYSVATTRPLIVEAPRDLPGGKYAADYVTFRNTNEIMRRHRMVYVMSNGYLHGYFGGEFDPSPARHGGFHMAFQYRDRDPRAGSELFRFGPSWAADAAPRARYSYDLNDIVQQPITTGQLSARELRIRHPRTGALGFRTVLIGAQGKNGTGYFSLDVSDPCTPSLLAEWRLPSGDTASNEPTVYSFPMRADPADRPAVISTAGVGGSNRLYAWDVASGAEIARVNLPPAPGRSYPSEPVCADVLGRGFITHCYVVRDDGLLVRVPVELERFGTPVDITPAGVVGGSRIFTTRPAVYFGASGAVSLVYGSGDYRNLNSPGVANFVYKVVDRDSRRSGVPNGRADIATACGGRSTSGVIALGNGERIISPPIVEKGLVAWTSYTPGQTSCIAGSAQVYAMNYETCADALGRGERPVGQDAGLGLPTSPKLHRASQSLLVGTSAGPTGEQTVKQDANTRGGRMKVIRRLYLRPEQDNR